MLIALNGYPGVGKLTIGRVLAELMGGRLLDIHTLNNLAFALTMFKSPEFYDTIRAIWEIADRRVAEMPPGEPLITTEVLTGQSDWARESWARLERLAQTRGPLFVVHVLCDLEENRRRIAGAARGDMRKPQDPEYADRNHAEGAELCGGDADKILRLDVTDLSPPDAAGVIRDWVQASV